MQDRIDDRFVIEGLVGRGGMGTVYRARDERTGSVVALKLINAPDAEANLRFAREATALSLVSHSSIVRYVAHGRCQSGQSYLAMEWIDGRNLHGHLEQGPLSLVDTLRLGRALAGALATVHAQGIIHRDLKPANVLLTAGESPRAVLVDFGVARHAALSPMTGTGAVVGTPQYMAPEQIQGSRNLDGRVDLFALGAVLYECLANRPAFVAEHAMAVLAKILVETPPSFAELELRVPADVERLVRDLLEKRPQDRPARAADVAARLDELLDTLPRFAASTPPGAPVPVLTARERRAISVVMATGVGDVSAIAETLTVEQAAGQTEPLEQLVRPHGGQLWPLGEGRVAVTFSGGATTDQAAGAARSALALTALYPQARVACAVGWAQVESVPVGEVIDRAVSLLSSAKPGRVRVDGASAGLLESRFRIEPSDVDCEVLSELESLQRPRTLLGRPTPCVGRERELSALSALLHEVATESVARAMLVTGTPGAGKSRLWHEFVERARRSHSPLSVLLSRAEALRAGSPLDLLAGLVRAAAGIGAGATPAEARSKLRSLVSRLIPSEAARVDVAEFLGEIVGAAFPNESSERLANARADARLMGAHLERAFLAWLQAEAREKPVVLILEDLQWGDPQTVKFLDAALRELKTSPLMIVALARPEVHERLPGLWKKRELSELPLGALGPRACHELVREVLGGADSALAERIVRHADGNALYLEELIRAAATSDVSALPISVLAMVQARLEALDTRSRRVLRAASVFGETFTPQGVEALVGDQPKLELSPTIEQLVDREIVTSLPETEGQYCFRHALVREAAYAMLTDADRKLGHGLAGSWLEGQGELDALLLAHHFERAADEVNAGRCYARAARQAVDKNDFEAALTCAKRAVELRVAGSALGEAQVVRGKALACLGRWAEAEAELDAALLNVSADDVERRMEVLREIFFVGTFRQSSDVLRRAGQEAMVLAAALSRSDLQAEANAAFATADHAEARCNEALERFRLAADGIGNKPSSVISLSSIMLYHTGRHEEAERLGRQMLKGATDMRDYGTVVILTANIGLSLAALGRYEEAREHFAAARSEAERCGLTTLAARSVSLSAGHHLDVLDLDGATRSAQEACDLGRALEFSTPRISASIDLAFIAVRRGDLSEAERIVLAIQPTVASGIGFHGWLWRERVLVLHAEMALLKGDYAAALALAERASAECRQHGRLKYEALSRIVGARAQSALGQGDPATQDLLALLDQLENVGDPALQLRVSSALLALSHQTRAQSVAEASATSVEAALPPADRPRFRAAVESSLRP